MHNFPFIFFLAQAHGGTHPANVFIAKVLNRTTARQVMTKSQIAAVLNTQLMNFKDDAATAQLHAVFPVFFVIGFADDVQHFDCIKLHYILAVVAHDFFQVFVDHRLLPAFQYCLDCVHGCSSSWGCHELVERRFLKSTLFEIFLKLIIRAAQVIQTLL